MTLNSIQAAIHALYEGDTDTPTSGDDDYTLRTSIVNAGINRWEHEEGVLWNELWVSLDDAVDGTKTTSAATYSYSCPTDFRFPGGYVRLVDSNSQSTYFSVIPVEKAQLYDNENKNICWFTGNPQDGYKVNFLDTQTASQTISYEYYKTADTLSSSTDVPEMVDPYFLVYFAVSRLFELDGQFPSSTKAFQEAEARLSQMKVRNMQSTWYQDARVEDWSTEQGVGGFGV